MAGKSVGVFHPGEMGSALAAALKRPDTEVLWLSTGRSAKTRSRAEREGLREVTSITEMVSRCELIVSICPPQFAEAVAQMTADAGYRGLYLDANAISTTRNRRLQQLVEARGAHYVDGAIVGSPPRKPGTTRMFLSGERAGEVASWFAGSPLETVVLEKPPGAASAVKMAYAGWSKGSTALLGALIALAHREGIWDVLVREWERSKPGLVEQGTRGIRGNARKGWRYDAEMEEIADTLMGAALPDGFHRGAAEIYRRLAAYKDVPQPPPLEEVISALLKTAVLNTAGKDKSAS